MGKDPLSWIGEGRTDRAPKGARASTAAAVEQAEAAPLPVSKTDSSEGPKFMTLVPVTARLSEPEIEWLDSVERRIMRNRHRKTERITKNTLLRAAVEILMSLECDYTDIADEEELVARLKQAARSG
jgi:hypothetical protein